MTEDSPPPPGKWVSESPTFKPTAGIRAAVAETGKTEREFSVELVSAAGEVHASCQKLISIRRREPRTS